MKIKILLAPSLIVLTIVAIIWYVYPAYTNGTDGIKEKRDNLAAQEKKMDQLNVSISNVSKLKNDLSANYSKNSAVFLYLPERSEEENIIESLNSMATQVTMSVINISVVGVKDQSPSQPVSTDSLGNPIADPAASAAAQDPTTPEPAPKKLEVSFSVVGDYDNIKNLMGNIQKLKRFNRFSDFEIKTLLNPDQGVSGSLEADMTLEFDYLPPVKRLLSGDVNDKVFTEGKFANYDVIDKIQTSRSVDVSPVTPGEKRGSNPFVVSN